jgi:hypothetical protein
MLRVVGPRFFAALVMGWAWCSVAFGGAAADEKVTTVVTDKEGTVRVLHESISDAFGDPIVATIAPPAPVDETALSSARPDAAAVWVPGYYRWNAADGKYEWVSGIWRRGIPNLVWYPGEWINVGNGYVWRAGYWGAATEAKATVVKVAPPEVRVETQSVSPGTGYVWVPGYWEYVNGQYVWRAGSWQLPAATDTIWVPAQWVKTSAGYQYVPGRWDFPVETRRIVVASSTADAAAAGELFAQADLNKDGKLSLPEIQSVRPTFTAEKLAGIDKDGDGILDPKEVIDFGPKLP